MWLLAIALDSVELGDFHHNRKFYWMVLVKKAALFFIHIVICLLVVKCLSLSLIFSFLLWTENKNFWIVNCVWKLNTLNVFRFFFFLNLKKNPNTVQQKVSHLMCRFGHCSLFGFPMFVNWVLLKSYRKWVLFPKEQKDKTELCARHCPRYSDTQGFFFPLKGLRDLFANILTESLM